MFSYDVQLSANSFVGQIAPECLRQSPVHAVVKYNRVRVEHQLIESGCDALLAARTASRIPDGFPIVVDETNGNPLRIVLLHLLAQHRRPKARMQGERSLNSALAGAYDLCHFLDHMDEMGCTFEQVIDQDLVDGFAEAQSLVPSSRTGVPLSRKTIARRIASVQSFCSSKAFKSIGTADFSTKLVPAFGQDRENTIHPMTAKDWIALKRQLGPKPLEPVSESQTCVMRLVVEWALWSAGRRTEIITIPLSEVEKHSDLRGPSGEHGVRRIRVTNTKGRRPREITIPTALLRETFAYIYGERAKAVAAAPGAEASELFLQPAMWRHPGRPISPAMASRRFKAAVIESGIKRRSWASGGNSSSNRHYVFHDLRHTAAVWLYIAFTKAGAHDPSKLVQGRLGHLWVETTRRTYLEFIDGHEPEIADMLATDYFEFAAA